MPMRVTVMEIVKAFEDLPDVAVVPIPATAMLCGGVANSTIYRWVQRGFLELVKTGPNSSGIRVRSIRTHLGGSL